ncbi:Methyltransferase MT-A70 family protein [Perilla frutescens var. hirtella]|uniref:Methyltransferase MT-A70 family protein n=1 Tax=Perilla frutescens var. hirtella TaxID=608512 RepID=A0AAD4J8L5_PERFH|nr:Methyltransferase MT-A70 family protein [Perilla frutescens var. hirtella]
MAASEPDGRLSAFLKSGIYTFDGANAFFIDPVRLLNRSYTRFRVSPSAYYSRFFPSSNFPIDDSPKNPKKRKCRGNEKKKSRELNSREQLADRRHQEVRAGLLKAHEALLGASELLEILRNLRGDGEKNDGNSISAERELDFVELGSVWQAPLYEIDLKVEDEDAGFESCCQGAVPLFDNLVANESSNDIEAELLDHKYILPKKSCFAESDRGFNLIMIDPPWENSSAHQKQKYQTLPNRHFLSLPIKQLTHSSGALVALWVTNREKLRTFVENELFPKWGVKYAATFYWLKVKANGFLISELDLFHHRPYECLLLGLSHGKGTDSEHLQREIGIPDNQVFISVPGDYSRKPPIGELLLDYVPGPKPAQCIELFAREMIGGWTSWGNEPLHFQDSRYFLPSTDK